MKAILILPILLVLVIAIVLSAQAKPDTALPVTSPSVLGQPESKNTYNFIFNNQNLKISWHYVDNPQNLAFIPNFNNTLSASEAFRLHNCSLLVNGGFYTKDFKPTGLFIHDGNQIKNEVSAALTNGFFTINHFNVPRITPSLPIDNLVHALQSGPLLIYNSLPQKTTNSADKNSRRMIVATTGENKIIFIAIYDSASVFSGPMLADVPEILMTLQANVELQIADALNLDGGSASAFINEEIVLSELSPVGSFFCHTVK